MTQAPKAGKAATPVTTETAGGDFNLCSSGKENSQNAIPWEGGRLIPELNSKHLCKL